MVTANPFGADEVAGQLPGLPLAAALARRAQGHDLGVRDRGRYSRHLLLPEVGLSGQLQLQAARVLIVGMGGLGSPVGAYLAAAGVGTLGLVDADVVDSSNLQRQILYSEADVGQPKVQAAAARLVAMNAGLQVRPYRLRLSAENADELLAGYDLVVDGTDNFATRYTLNDACVRAAKPYVYGSVLRFTGQAAVFYAPHGPCYRCLFPRPPPPGSVPSCAEGGVLGVLPGQIGLIQATETLKLLLGIGTPLLGRLLTYDALTLQTATFNLPRDPACPACGETARRTVASPNEIEFSHCEVAPVSGQLQESEIGVDEYHELRRVGAPHALIDVRNAAEAAICKIAGSRLIPLGELPGRLAELPRDVPLIVHCKVGGRSAMAVEILQAAGFAQARSLVGGILAWGSAYDPTLARY